jgi:hypothetical protein
MLKVYVEEGLTRIFSHKRWIKRRMKEIKEKKVP